MSGDTSAFGFGKFIPGFEFLQGLAQGAGAAASPLGRVPQWVAPTVSVEEVDKRIAELKAVQFWLEQNGRALAATIQALEVQRMTLSTLQGMNVSMSDLAKNFPFPGGQAAASAYTGWPMGAGSSRHEEPASEPAAAPVPQPEPQAEAAKHEADASDAAASAQQQTQAALGQAMQWWGALTQQFQQIAAKAMAEPVPAETMAAAQRATEAASSFAKSAMDKVMEQAGTFTPGADAKAAGKPKPAAEASAATAKAGVARKPAAQKTAAQKPATKAAAAPAARKRAAAPRKS